VEKGLTEPSEQPEEGGAGPAEAPSAELKPAEAPTGAAAAQATESQPTEGEVHASRVAGALLSLVPDVVAEPARQYVRVVVPVDALEAAARTLRDNLGYALLSMVTAVDYQDRIEVVYLAFALEHPYGVEIRAVLPREELPDCPSLTTVWPGAEFQEREVYDLMGINFVSHPDLRRILTDDDFPGHPLRKDFSIDPDYVLMRHLRYGVEGQLRPEGEEGSPANNQGGNGAEPSGPTT
jgi:NADH-quinone oxidoreductase subunit C